jgi:ferredoxin
MTDLVHVRVHPEHCMSSGSCIRIAPTVFDADEDGWVRLLSPTPTPDEFAAVARAAESCPTGAIIIEEATPTQNGT